VTVYLPKSSPYYHYDFQFKGRRYNGSTGQKTKRKAEEYERFVRNKATTPSHRRDEISISEAIALYQSKIESQSSQKTTAYILRDFQKSLGPNTFLSDVTPLKLQKHFIKRKEKRSTATINREVDTIQALWRYIDKMRYNIGDMPDWASLRRRPPKLPIRELSYEDQDRLLEAMRGDLRDVIEFLLTSGWRRNEVINLKWTDCNFEQKTARSRLKGGDTVQRPLTDNLAAIIRRQPTDCESVFSYLCEKGNGARKKGQRQPLTANVLRNAFEAAREKINLPHVRLHDLRHTCATRIVRNTGSLVAAKTALQHTNLNTTLRYAQATPEDVRKALDAANSRNIPGISK
jgi:integrase